MDAKVLKQEISSLKDMAQDAVFSTEDHHAKLFDVFRRIEASLGDLSAGAEPEDDSRAAGLIEAQSVVIRLAAALPARTVKDLLYKLALWRWDSAELDRPIETMNRADAIAYSAFLDLAEMLGEGSVLKDFDKNG